jgi:hypothetical protein
LFIWVGNSTTTKEAVAEETEVGAVSEETEVVAVPAVGEGADRAGSEAVPEAPKSSCNRTECPACSWPAVRRTAS